jgi:hypothetical protein
VYADVSIANRNRSEDLRICRQRKYNRVDRCGDEDGAQRLKLIDTRVLIC